ncbi:hypothetical protein NPIL_280911 [Nephila pilipes]|uniref:Uncharacterized protein n=1 Tax=Nephila pilipes TaxID=299642 RepID=A0A8X6MFC1_NEPPI|nr:hypothetical protein NPIL_280911 [Nephila pilipes]
MGHFAPICPIPKHLPPDTSNCIKKSSTSHSLHDSVDMGTFQGNTCTLRGTLVHFAGTKRCSIKKREVPAYCHKTVFGLLTGPPPSQASADARWPFAFTISAEACFYLLTRLPSLREERSDNGRRSRAPIKSQQ